MKSERRMYQGAIGAKGSLLFLKSLPEAKAGEMITVQGQEGPPRQAQILRLDEKLTVAQVYQGCDALDLPKAKIQYTAEAFRLRLGPQLLGRRFNGLGEAVDGGGPFLGTCAREIHGRPMNPTARRYPRDYIHTGISAIDVLMTLIRGQKLPLFSGAGLPHRDLAAQLISQAGIQGAADDFCVVFGAMGMRSSDLQYFEEVFAEGGNSQRLVSFINHADDPVAERLSAPRCALTAAEYLAFDLHKQVLVVLMDMSAYCEALREISSARDEVPGRKGYPGYLYSDLASLYERAGILAEGQGSLTMLPILTMPGDDISHPIPDLTGFITEGQIVLSRRLDQAGIRPPIAILPSLSRLMKDGIGAGYTREDHADLANQLFSSMAQIEGLRQLAQILSQEDLPEQDQALLAFGEAFEAEFLSQGRGEERSLEESLDLGWRLLAMLPDAALERLSAERIQSHVAPWRQKN